MFGIAVKKATSFYCGKSQHDAQVEAMHRIDEKLKSMDAKLGTSQVQRLVMMVKGYHEAIDVWHPILEFHVSDMLEK